MDQTLGDVSQACKVMGYSRDSLYRFKELYDRGGELALQEISRRKTSVENRVEEHVEQAVIELVIEQPALGQVRISNKLKKRGIFISPGGVLCITGLGSGDCLVEAQLKYREIALHDPVESRKVTLPGHHDFKAPGLAIL